MKTKFIIFIVAIIFVVIGLGLVSSKQGPSKYDDFAKALKSSGAQFYGAFWCPHCLAEKALFGSAKKYLPYVECSNPDKSPTPICTENKVESYPAWTFKDGVTLLSKGEPTICKPSTENATDEAPVCAQVASKFYKTWIFPDYRFSIKSPTDPIKTGETWKFEAGAQTQGEIPLEFLAQQIGFTLPQ